MTVNRYKKAGVPLDQSIRTWMQTGDGIRIFRILQESGIALMDHLLNQPDGAYAVIHGYAHWVSPIDDAIELIISPQVIGECDLHFCLSNRENNTIYTRIEDVLPGKDAASEYQKAIDVWLLTPNFSFLDQDLLDDMALIYCLDETIKKTKVLSRSIKKVMREASALDSLIHTYNTPDNNLSF